MDRKISVLTIFTFLLFAVSTDSLVFDSDVVLTNSNSLLSNEKQKSDLDETTADDHTTQTFDVSTIDPLTRLNFARLHPINRHFFDKTTRFVRRHPCRKFGKMFMIPQTKMSDVIVSTQTYDLGDQVPTKWLEFKNYGHHHHHGYHHVRDEEFKFDRKKTSHHHKEKREDDGGFMKRIRKFLKHTFD